MKNKRNTTVTMEIHEITIVRINQNESGRIFCSDCRTYTKHVRVASAAAAAGISETAIFRLIENDRIHSTETQTGALFVCQNSLSDLARELQAALEKRKRGKL